jgi:hypothetical protein
MHHQPWTIREPKKFQYLLNKCQRYLLFIQLSSEKLGEERESKGGNGDQNLESALKLCYAKIYQNTVKTVKVSSIQVRPKQESPCEFQVTSLKHHLPYCQLLTQPNFQIVAEYISLQFYHAIKSNLKELMPDRKNKDEPQWQLWKEIGQFFEIISSPLHLKRRELGDDCQECPLMAISMP